MSGRGRVNQVLLIEIALAADAFEQERNQRGVILSRQLGIDALKAGRVIRAQVGRNLHAGDDNFDRRIFRLRFVDDRLEVGFQRFDRLPAQTVVSSQGDHEHVDGALKQPVGPPERAGARVPTQAGVLDFEGQTGRANLLGDQRRKSLSWLHAQSRGQAVAKESHGFGWGRNRRLRGLAENCCRKKPEAERNSANCWHRFPHARRIMFA